MSNAQWFYADAQQQQQGPVTFDQIQQLAASGQIQPTTLIWNEGMPNWTAANQVQGVFNAAPAPVAAPPVNPYATPGSANPMGAQLGGAYPIPPVKRCSFGLYLTLMLVGVAAYVIGAVMAFSKMSDTAAPYREGIPKLETQEDLNQFQQTQDQRIEEMSTEDLPMAAFGVIAIGVLILLAGGILGLVYLYRAWCILQPGGARTSPGKAVGFLFIPLFNIYWIFVAYSGWSPDWNRIRNSHANLANIPPSSDGLFLAGPICILCTIIPFLGLLAAPAYLIIFLMMTHKMCSVVNAMADARQGQ